MSYIIIFLLAAIISGLVVYLTLKPKLQQTVQINNSIIEQNRKLELENKQLIESNSILDQEHTQLILERGRENDRLENLRSTIKVAEEQATEAANALYKSKMDAMKDCFAKDAVRVAQEHQENVEAFKKQYEETVAHFMEQYNQMADNVRAMRAINDAAVLAAKRAEEMKTAKDFYRIQLDDIDIEEIKALRSIEHLLRDKEPLNKVIWKCYYEKPTTDLIGRVIGGGIHTGIYKITEIETGKCYVGQAANLADRWKQHIKRGVGADAPTRNKLYPAMIAAGPENFTFEVIEECSRALLDEREKYWTDYFKAQEFGFSIRKG